MDWKDLLASKVNDGTLRREEYVPEDNTPARTPDTLRVTIDRKGRKGKTATLSRDSHVLRMNCLKWLQGSKPGLAQAVLPAGVRY